jgi:hypothetical protein
MLVVNFAQKAYLDLDCAEALCRTRMWDMTHLEQSLASQGATALCAAEGVPHATLDGPVADCAGGDAAAQTECSLCGDETSSPLFCGHRLCADCLSGALDAAFTDAGPLGLLMLTCPCLDATQEKRCPAVLPMRLVLESLPEARREPVATMWRADFLGHARGLQPCPAPHCARALHALPGIADCDMRCRCGALACAACGLAQGHQPASCGFPKLYARIMDPDRLSRTRIAVTVKPCPTCKREIEKVLWCNHIRCPCGAHWCWLCGANWTDCGGSADAYKCEKYDADAEAEVQRVQDTRGQQLMLVHQRTCAEAVATAAWAAAQAQAAEDPAHDSLHAELPLLREALLVLEQASVAVQWCFALAPFVAGNARGVLAETQRQHLLGLVNRLHEMLKGDLTEFRVSQRWSDLQVHAGATARFRMNILRGYQELDIDSLVRDNVAAVTSSDLPWCCVMCNTLHRGRARQQLSLSSDAEVMEDTEGAIPVVSETGKDICSNKKCKSCREHSEYDCRVCVPFKGFLHAAPPLN